MLYGEILMTLCLWSTCSVTQVPVLLCSVSLPGWYLICRKYCIREYHFRKYYFSARLVFDLQRKNQTWRERFNVYQKSDEIVIANLKNPQDSRALLSRHLPRLQIHRISRRTEQRYSCRKLKNMIF